MLTQLEPALKEVISEAKKIYFATALINTYGLNLIMKNVPFDCEIKLLIGIDLPSEGRVLKRLYDSESSCIQSRIYSSDNYFHPKVYIVENKKGRLKGFVGSANATAGGLVNNIEITVEIENQHQCDQLLSWFNEQFQQSAMITADFLERYMGICRNMIKRASSNKANSATLRKLLTADLNQVQVNVSHEQFFEESHYEAYTPINERDYSDQANQRRKQVRLKLKELHDAIYPNFSEYEMNELHCHPHRPSIISHYQFRKGFNRPDLRSMWLHYGYSDFSDDFASHPRLQVIIHYSNVGVWFVVGRNSGSCKEREGFKQKLRKDSIFRDYVFHLFADIGGDYNISIADRDRSISDFECPEDLFSLLKEDNLKKYFIIYRNYKRSDPAISKNSIQSTILSEFTRLYPLYKVFRSFR